MSKNKVKQLPAEDEILRFKEKLKTNIAADEFDGRLPRIEEVFRQPITLEANNVDSKS